MRVEHSQNNKPTSFYELKVGTPFYVANTLVLNEHKTLFMKTDEFEGNLNNSVNAVAIESGTLVNIDRFQDVEIAKVHVESDKG